MNYILFKADGSLNKQKLDYYIQQSSTGVNTIFVSIADSIDTDICQAVFTLPNETQNTVQGIVGSLEIEGVTYTGWNITLTSDQTLYNGLLQMSVRIIRGSTQILANYPVALVINETGIMPDTDTGVTIQEINSYLVFLYSLEEQIADDYALKNEVVPLKTADNSTTLDDICGTQSSRCFVKFNNKTYYLEATYAGGNYICYIQELGRVGRWTGSAGATSTFANALTTLTQRDYIDMTTNQDITGIKTLKNRLIVDGFSGSGVISLYESNINTNNKNSFAKVWVDSANYVNYNLPYGPSDAGHNLQTYVFATESYVQQQIEEVEMQSDVIDVVGTYADLQAYDTQHVKENDLIKVITDSTHNNATSYYRWVSNAWVYVASEGPYYTISQVDSLFVAKTTQIAGINLQDNIAKNELFGAIEISGHYETLEDLQTAHLTGDSNIYVIDSNWNWYYWNGSAWTSGGVYNNEKPIDDELNYYSKNSVQNKVVSSKMADYYESVGTKVYGKWKQSNGNEYTADYASYIVVDVKPGEKYRVSGTDVSSSFPFVAFFNGNTFVSSLTYGTNYAWISEQEVAIPNGVNKMYVNFSWSRIQSLPHRTSIVEKKVYKKVNVSDLTNNQSKSLKWTSIGSVVEGKAVSANQNTGLIQFATTYFEPYGYIKVEYENGRKYRFSGRNITTEYPFVIFADEEDRLISYFGSGMNESTSSALGYCEKEIEIPLGTKYIYCQGLRYGYNNSYYANPLIEIASEKDLVSYESGKTIVCLGDSITQGVGVNNGYSDTYAQGNPVYTYLDYPTKVKEMLNANVFNGGLGGGMFAGNRAIDFTYVVDAIVSGDYTAMYSAITSLGLNSFAKVNWDRIQELDFTKVDIITIFYGTNDFGSGTLDNASDKYDRTTILGALRYGVKKLIDNFPQLKIYVFTPFYRGTFTGTNEDSDTYVSPYLNMTLYELGDKIKECANLMGLPTKQMYYESGINVYNRSNFLSNDYVHPNYKGYELIGREIAKFINDN